MIKILFLFLMFSCAHKSGIKEEIKKGNISLASVLDLGRSSYLKGCVDSKNEFSPKLKESSFIKCREMAIKHENELLEILK